MAIVYLIYSDLDKTDLQSRLNDAALSAGRVWETWAADNEQGPFHEEIMEEYGIDRGFRTYVYCRHSKDHTVEARKAMLAFYESLPGRKLILNGDVFVAYHLG